VKKQLLELEEQVEHVITACNNEREAIEGEFEIV
jgi:hypothetical protein